MDLYQSELSRLHQKQQQRRPDSTGPRAPSVDRSSSGDGAAWDGPADREGGREEDGGGSTPSPFSSIQSKFDQNFGHGRLEAALPTSLAAGGPARMSNLFPVHPGSLGFQDQLMAGKNLDSPLQVHAG